jgi:hypothetical protein
MAIATTALRCLRTVSIALLLIASRAPGQTSPAAPPQSIEDALHQMSDRADIIFAGQVVAVRRHDEEGAAAGYVEVEFRVDQAIRGCTAGAPYLLHEWAGLWTGAQRYRVGQSLLMFLHAPGSSGLSSPVGGMDGAIPIHGSTSPLIATGTSVTPYPVADLRWIATQVMRPVSYQSQSLQPSHRAALPVPFLVPQPMAGATAASVEHADIPAKTQSSGNESGTSSVPAQQASVEAVVAMLLSWQKAQDAVR